MANDPVIEPDSGSSGPAVPAAGSVVPASISTSPTDSFVFPDNLEIQGQGNGGQTGAVITIRGQGTGAKDFTMKNIAGNLYWRNETNNQFLMYLDTGAGALVMGAYSINLNNLQIVNISNLAIGASVNVASAVLQADSTSGGFLPPRMTTSQKNGIGSPAEGLMVYDTDLHSLCVYNGSAWKTVTAV